LGRLPLLSGDLVVWVNNPPEAYRSAIPTF
jgi:hypothetical protein